MNINIDNLDEDEMQNLVFSFHEKTFELLNIPYTIYQYAGLDSDEKNLIANNNILNIDHIKLLRNFIISEIEKYGVDINKNRDDVEILFKLLLESTIFKINYNS